MNKNIAQLYHLSSKPVKRIIGLMSGTSFDGLDVALCEFTGSGTNTEVQVLHFTTVNYEEAFKQDLKSIFSKRVGDIQKVTLLHAFIGTYFAELVLSCLKEWHIDPSSVDLIASHGQTIFHAPKSLHHLKNYANGTLQIGDGDHLAVKTGIITISDFRQKHIAAGGEGAPLAVYGDYLLFSSMETARILLNIGGIANFTYLPAGKTPKGIFSTDVGPGNTLMDQYMQLNFPGKYYDEGAQLALSGSINQPLLKALLDNPFFNAGFPKTTGPELFSLAYLQLAITKSYEIDLKHEDVMATLSAFSAQSIIMAIKKSVPQAEPFEIYVSGGGMHNPLLMQQIEKHFGLGPIHSTASLGINPDAKEAVLFALLANEAVAGGTVDYGNPVGFPSVSLGKISFPG